MLSGDAQMLAGYRAQGRAIGAFSVYNMETVQAVVAAAESTGLPVLIQAGASAFSYAGRDSLAELALGAAARAAVSVGVHLDHSRDLDEIAACIELGYTSVMYDGSHLEFAANVTQTAAAAKLAHAAGIWIEGELGAIAGDEDRSTGATAAAMTDPGEAAEFVRLTGVDALAVAVGNVHGFTPGGTNLDLDRLAAIAAAVPVPLVLHGASGVDRGTMAAAARTGVVKFNVNAELRRALFDSLDSNLDAEREGYALAGLLAKARGDVAEVAAEIVSVLHGNAASPAAGEGTS